MTDLTEIIPAADYARVAGEAKKQSTSAKLHGEFAHACRVRRLPEPKWKGNKELMFAKEAMGRRWVFDFAWPEYLVAVEIEGLVCRKLFDGEGKPHNVVMGRHATIGGFIEDANKYNAAAILGWTVLRFAQAMLKDGTAIDTTVRLLHARGWRPGITPMVSDNRAPLATTRHTIDMEVHPDDPARTIAMMVNETRKKPAPAPSKASRKSPPAARAASASGVSLPVSGTNGAEEAPGLPPLVLAIAEAYPAGEHDWSRMQEFIGELAIEGATPSKLALAANQYRKQFARQQQIDRQAGKVDPITGLVTTKPLTPEQFFSTDAWKGPFPMPEDPLVAEAERETSMTNEEWLRSSYAKG